MGYFYQNGIAGQAYGEHSHNPVNQFRITTAQVRDADSTRMCCPWKINRSYSQTNAACFRLTTLCVVVLGYVSQAGHVGLVSLDFISSEG